MRATRVVMLTGIWLALWSDLSVANALSGVLVAVLITAVFGTWRGGITPLRPVAALRFGGFFLVQLVRSSIVVAHTVVAPRRRIHTGIVAVPLSGCSDAVATLIADAITLTPGTLTLEVRRDPLTLYVHALDVRDLEGVRAGIRRLEVLAVRAFGSREALAGLEHDDSRSWRSR